MFAVLPCKTRVENIGFDGSGVHNPAQETRFAVSVESDLAPVRFEDLSEDARIKRELQKIFKIPFSLKIKRKVAEGFDFQTLQTVQPRVLKVRVSSFVNRMLGHAGGFEF